MQQELARVIEQVSKEKGIDRSIVVQAVENAMLSAAKKVIGGDMRIEAQYNPEIGEVELFKILTVVEQVTNAELEISLADARQNLDPEAQLGDELLEKLAQSYGRIAAQAAKQNLIQRLRDAERDIIYNEFKDRKGELTHSGIVQRFEKKNIIVNLGRTDAILPEKEQIPRERYRQGDRIRAFILDVEMGGKGPQIVLSRTHPGLSDQAVRAGGPGDLREHRRGQGRRPRAGRPGKDRRGLARPGRRPGRRLRGNEGNARAERRAGVARREDRHRALDAGPGRVRRPCHGALAGREDRHGRGRALDGSRGPGRPAVARDRQEGAERPPGLTADGLEPGSPQRIRGRRRSRAARGSR